VRLCRPTTPWSAIPARVCPPPRPHNAILAGNGSASAATCGPGHGHALATDRHPAIGPKRPIPIAERLGPRGFLLRRLSYASRRPKLFTRAASLLRIGSPRKADSLLSTRAGRRDLRFEVGPSVLRSGGGPPDRRTLTRDCRSPAHRCFGRHSASCHHGTGEPCAPSGHDQPRAGQQAVRTWPCTRPALHASRVTVTRRPYQEAVVHMPSTGPIPNRTASMALVPPLSAF